MIHVHFSSVTVFIEFSPYRLKLFIVKMIDIFLKEDFLKLFKNKKLVFMGDSNIRALYKDFLSLSKENKFISQKTLRKKMENSCFGDQLVRHGQKTNGRSYREERKFKSDFQISFFFLTCIYDEYVASILDQISKKENLPDVVIVNSCVWDVTRWGPQSVTRFKNNLVTFMKEVKKFLPDCLVIWVTAPPIAVEIRGGFLVKELEFLKYSLRFHIMEANQYARKVVVDHGYDILDTHYHLKMQLHRRENDGIHWSPSAVRYMTNSLLTHISLAWNVPLPHRYQSEDIEQEIAEASENKTLEITSDDHIIDDNKYEKENTKKRKRTRRASKSKIKESHHRYMCRVDKEYRQKRIRQWQTESLNTPSRKYFKNIYEAPFENRRQYQYQPYIPPANQMSTSNQMYNPPANPSLLPLPSEAYSYEQYAPSLLPLPSETYSYEQYAPSLLPLPSETYSYEQYQRYPCDSLPLSNMRTVICSPPSRQPYIFPNPNQHLKPMFNFSSDDNPFGVEF